MFKATNPWYWRDHEQFKFRATTQQIGDQVTLLLIVDCTSSIASMNLDAENAIRFRDWLNDHIKEVPASYELIED